MGQAHAALGANGPPAPDLLSITNGQDMGNFLRKISKRSLRTRSRARENAAEIWDLLGGLFDASESDLRATKEAIRGWALPFMPANKWRHMLRHTGQRTSGS